MLLSKFLCQKLPGASVNKFRYFKTCWYPSLLWNRLRLNALVLGNHILSFTSFLSSTLSNQVFCVVCGCPGSFQVNVQQYIFSFLFHFYFFAFPLLCFLMLSPITKFVSHEDIEQCCFQLFRFTGTSFCIVYSCLLNQNFELRLWNVR